MLSDASLYEFTGGEPPDVETLRRRYEAQVTGPSDMSERWYNWIVRLANTHAAVGFVQATVTTESADVAWVIGTGWQGNGYAAEAARAMCQWLGEAGVVTVEAHIHPDHIASERVAAACGLAPSAQFDSDGERMWTSNRS